MLEIRDDCIPAGFTLSDYPAWALSISGERTDESQGASVYQRPAHISAATFGKEQSPICRGKIQPVNSLERLTDLDCC